MSADATAAVRADPIPLAQALIRCPSVTPADAGALDVLEQALKPLGFTCRRLPFGEVDNLFATRGAGHPHLLFAGHTDVVPVGDAAAWTVDPFAATIRDGKLIARGASDMKAAIAAFVSAAGQAAPARGTISLLITGDEEGASVDGTVKAIAALAGEGMKFDHCLIGEPASDRQFADQIKIGRRGSINIAVTVEGVQGHVAYPEKTVNPVPVIMDFLDALRLREIDKGAPGFQPSHLEITSIDVGGGAHNVINARATAKLNIRFNPAQTGQGLAAWIEAERQKVQAAHPRARVHAEAKPSGEAFYCAPGPFSTLLQDAAESVTGARPALSTAGGTSDGRFIHRFCPCAELGLINETAHKVDEFAYVEDVRALAAIYERVINAYFQRL